MNSTYITNKVRKTGYEETEFTKALSTLFLIRTEMENSKVGIANLQKTYELDIQIISQLEVIINKVDGHIGIIDRKLKEIQTEHVPEQPPTPIPQRGVRERDQKDSK